MKKVLCAALILFVYAAVSAAQEKTIDQKQFDAVYQNARENWKGKTHRLTITTLSSVDGRPQTDYSSKAVFEFASPTINRSVLEANFQSVSKKTEAIRIGGKIYARAQDGKWREGAFEAQLSPPEIKSSVGIDSANREVVYKYLGIETINNRPASVYAKTEKEKRAYSSTNKEELSTTVTKYWFGDDGLILKSEMQAESRAGEMIYRTHLTQIWESAPDIKIEAPNLN